MQTLTLNPNEPQLPEQWARFSERAGEINDRLLRELESCWRDIHMILKGQIEVHSAIIPSTLTLTDLDAFRGARADAARRLLIESATQWERRRPYQRALLGIEGYDRGLSELVESLPEAVTATGPLALELMKPPAATGLTRRLAGLRRKPRPLPMRAIVAVEARRIALQRARIEGRLLMVLAQAIQQLRGNWEARREALDSAAQSSYSPQREAAARKKEAASYAELMRQAERVLADWREWSGAMAPQFAGALLKGIAWRRKIKPEAPAAKDEQHAAWLAHWGEQARSVEEELKFELTLQRSEDDMIGLSQRGLDSLTQERGYLLAELDGFIDWLRRCPAGDGQTEDWQTDGRADMPPLTDVVPASSRLAELEAELKGSLQKLPEQLRLLTKFSAVPRRWSQPRELHPVATAREAFERRGRDEVRATFASVEAVHRRLVQIIERAREVVAFGLGEGEAARTPDAQIAREACQNALSLLEFHRRETPLSLTEANARFTRMLAEVFNEYRLILSRSRLGAFTYLGQQGLRQAVVLGGQSALDLTRRWSLRSLRKLQELGHGFLVSIGWLPEPSTSASQVVIRPFLPREFTADLDAKQLPAIYRRLFRFEAVQDPRFLVGRDREMEAIADARVMWEAGRPVAVLMIGERGSGKTSLINCALKRKLEGVEVVRGEFSERLSNAEQLRKFLAQLFGVNDPAELESALGQRRRVVILEELERSFLRQIGHYAAMRELQRLVTASSATTLWIIVTNQIAFRFLDAAVGLGQSFSHRLNAASADRDALREAVLLRHNLSGLRLQFALPPDERTLANRLGIRLFGQADPEKIFFDQLARLSAGVFRTTFEIWLGQIETVQAGALIMKPLASPDLAPFVDALNLDDLFTLVAVLQHGSLTPDEHAVIFQKSLSASRARIDELLAREILEPDPNRPGLRVRPEALRVVQEALYRRNLL
ncbi:MAG: ATP-binding protein [Acidobacteriota bacterium]